MSLDISIIILSYNTKELTRRCLDELVASLHRYKKVQSEIIVIDNASEDGSVQELQRTILEYQDFESSIVFNLIVNNINIGYPKGNNEAIKQAGGEYVLFLNSDVMVGDLNWEYLLNEMRSHKRRGAMTVSVLLPSGKPDRAAHRGFPTPWNSFCYFMKLEFLLGSVPVIGRFFGGYHLTDKPQNQIHNVDVISGAFFLSRTKLIQDLQGFDESYFMYGEDIDLCFRIKEKGYVIVFDPTQYVVHHKYQSGLQHKNKSRRTTTRRYFFNAMRIFVDKHYRGKYSNLTIYLVKKGIDIISFFS